MSRPNFLELLSERGWYRSRDRWDLSPAGHTVDLKTDSIAAWLRRNVSVYNYRSLIYWEIKTGVREKNNYTREDHDSFGLAGGSTPRIYFEDELCKKLYEASQKANQGDTHEEGLESSDELVAHLELLIPLFQSKTHRFFNSTSDRWFEERDIKPKSKDRVYADAYLHAEVWKCEVETEKPVWVLMALRPGHRVPNYDIEWSVHDLVVNSREFERTFEFRNVKGILEDDFQLHEEPVITEERREKFEKAVDAFGREEYYDRLDNPKEYELRYPKFY